jgi:glycosyltransferase involved in cell wall biosynthesis
VLTIAIPTYNRNDLLKDCVLRLLPQLNRNHQLILVDNCSDVTVQETLEKCIEDWGDAKIRFIRNAGNIGGAANLLRCLELCETQWLYCLGDDDLVAHDCILLIEKAIATHADSLYLSFSRDLHRRANDILTEGLAEFINNFDDWNAFLFMSASVVNAGKLRTYIRWGYLYAYSWAPFQAILLKMLNEGGTVFFCSDVICIEESRADEAWVSFPVIAGKMILPELIEDERLRPMFARRLMVQTPMLSLIYWARITAKNSDELARFRLFVNLYIDRRAFYVGLSRMLLFKIVAFVVLRPRLIPAWLFNTLTALSFKLLRRRAPNARAMNYDRT